LPTRANLTGLSVRFNYQENPSLAKQLQSLGTPKGEKVIKTHNRHGSISRPRIGVTTYKTDAIEAAKTAANIDI